jgi:hypothetical protein
MARRRLRARVNWAMRWGGLATTLLLVAALGATFLLDGASPALIVDVGGLTAGAVVFRGEAHVVLMQATTPLVLKEDQRGDRRLLFESIADFDRFSKRRRLSDAETTPGQMTMEQIQTFPAGWTARPRKGRLSLPSFSARWFPLQLWPLLLAPATVCMLGWWRGWHRHRPGHCPSCRYDLSGLPPGSPCPECAAAPPPVVKS